VVSYFEIFPSVGYVFNSRNTSLNLCSNQIYFGDRPVNFVSEDVILFLCFAPIVQRSLRYASVGSAMAVQICILVCFWTSYALKGVQMGPVRAVTSADTEGTF
jgi:hypothetical protein